MSSRKRQMEEVDIRDSDFSFADEEREETELFRGHRIQWYFQAAPRWFRSQGATGTK